MNFQCFIIVLMAIFSLKSHMILTNANITDSVNNTLELTTLNYDNITDSDIDPDTQVPEDPSESTPILPTSTTDSPIEDHLYQLTGQEFCMCDLKIHECDVNCCCDRRCSDVDRQVFSHCADQSRHDSEYCFPPDFKFISNVNFKTFTTDEGIFCIVTDNLKSRSKFPLVESIDNLRDFNEKINSVTYYSWNEKDANSEDVNFDKYKVDSPLLIINNFNEIQPLSLPSSFLDSNCDASDTVLYLRDISTKCQIQSSELQDPFSFQNLFKFLNYSVISDPSLIYSNKTDMIEELTPQSPSVTESVINVTESNDDFGNSTLNNASNTTINNTNFQYSDEDIDTLNALKFVIYICDFPGPGICNQSDFITMSKQRDFDVIKILIEITHNGSLGIDQVNAFVYKTPKSDIDVIKVVLEVKFFWVGTTKESIYKRSGRPGYITGQPILAGKVSTNSSLYEETIEAINLNTDPSQWLTVLSGGTNGECDTRIPVNFGENLKSGCKYKIKNCDVINNCTRLKKEILQNLLGPLFINFTDWRIASYGDSSVNNIHDWLPIFSDEEFIIKETSEEELNKCIGVRNSMLIEIAYTLQGSLSNPQPKLIGVNLKLGPGNDLKLSCTFNSCPLSGVQNIVLTASVSYIEVSESPQPYYAQPPSIDVKLPYDFFYPFLP